MRVRNPQRQECAHGVVERLAVAAVELGHDEEDECQRHVLEEVAVGAGSELQGAVFGPGGRGRGGGGGILVAEVDFGADSLGKDPAREENVVQGEGSDPCAGDCWVWVSRAGLCAIMLLRIGMEMHVWIEI